MVVYWSGCLATIVMTWFVLHVKHRTNSWIYKFNCAFFSVLPLTVIAAIRYDVGQDYLYGYVPYFLQVQSGTGQGRMEILYYWLNQIVVWAGGSYEWVFAVTAVVFMTLVSAQIIKDSPCPELSVFLLVSMNYYFIFFNVMRQMVGCAILLFSLRYVQKKKFWPFLACVLLAAGFHTTCLLFVIVYFFDKIEIKPVTTFLITGILIVITPLINRLATAIIMKTEYSAYLNSKFDTGEQGYVVLAINILLVVFAMVFYQKNDKYQLYYKLQVIAMWIACLTGKVVMINRLRWMFGLPSIILVPMALKNIKDKRNRLLLLLGIIVMYSIYFSYTIGVNNSNNVLPYRTIFTK